MTSLIVLPVATVVGLVGATVLTLRRYLNADLDVLDESPMAVRAAERVPTVAVLATLVLPQSVSAGPGGPYVGLALGAGFGSVAGLELVRWVSNSPRSASLVPRNSVDLVPRGPASLYGAFWLLGIAGLVLLIVSADRPACTVNGFGGSVESRATFWWEFAVLVASPFVAAVVVLAAMGRPAVGIDARLDLLLRRRSVARAVAFWGAVCSWSLGATIPQIFSRYAPSPDPCLGVESKSVPVGGLASLAIALPISACALVLIFSLFRFCAPAEGRV